MTSTDANPGRTVLYSLRDGDELTQIGTEAREAARRSAVPPYRGLSLDFLDALDALIEADHGRWWRDVLSHPDLILAVRSEALDVYHRGASVFRVRRKRGQIVPDTHAKYLVRQAQTRVALTPEGVFAHGTTPGLWDRYAGPQTLAEMIRAAGSLVGVEKTGVHALVMASATVVDVEIALAGEDWEDGNDGGDAGRTRDADPGGELGAPPPSAKLRQDRIDVASLEERGHPGQAWLVFHEAKDYSNAALRAAPKRQPGIVVQVGRYRGSLTRNEGALAASYPFVCKALVRLDAMRRRVRARHPDWVGRAQPGLDPLIAAVADGTRALRVEREPRLVVFGYDRAQKAVWEGECARLRSAFGLRVYAVGDPAASKVAAAFRRPADVPLTPIPPPPVPPGTPPDRIPLPPGIPTVPCLYFQSSGPSQPVYLCNPGDATLTAVCVESIGVTTHLHTGVARHSFPEAPAGAGLLVDVYDVMADGDRLTPYTIHATLADGTQVCASPIIGKGGPASCFVPLAFAPILDASTASSAQPANGILKTQNPDAVLE